MSIFSMALNDIPWGSSANTFQVKLLQAMRPGALLLSQNAIKNTLSGMFEVEMQDEPEDLSLSSAERNSRTRFWNFVERKKKSGEIVLACSACLMVFADPLLYRMHVGTHAIGRSFQCVACGTVCSDRVAFQKHLITARHG